MDVVLALAAALAFAVGTVLQQRVAEQADADEALRAGFLLRLARQPLWLVGVAADGAGFAFQAWALAVGRLVVVQPVLVTSVVFALPLGARLRGQRASRRELTAAVAVTVGLAAFLLSSNPGSGTADATTAAWIASGAGCALVSGLLVAAARRAAPQRRAALLGIATGILFGLSALLTKTTVDRLDGGILHVLADWHVYALAVVGWISLTLSQAALQTGALAPAIATMLAVDSIASVLLGAFALDEGLRASPLRIVGAALALVVMIAGIAVLANAKAEPDAPPGVR
ncbi:MAG: hypothetical protein JWQ48_3023 [Conexibacter sp.]|nr:hypothetical protein [Conexibacter sp.]